MCELLGLDSAHVRYASQGKPCFRNRHPFLRNFYNQELGFAHNGNMGKGIKVMCLQFHPIGETDSEHLLFALLSTLSEESIAFADFQRIEALLRELNRYGTMNLLFSEGEHLYCYRDKNGYNGLCMTERVAPLWGTHQATAASCKR